MKVMEDIYKIIRNNIKKYRLLKGLTQAELAEKANLTHDYIRQIESNKVANTFSVQTLYDISVALDVELSDCYLIENNIINVVIKKDVTTLYNQFKKGMKQWLN